MVPADDERSAEEAVVQWIYQLNRARVVRGEKVILDDVTLSFLPGAKIGVRPQRSGEIDATAGDGRATAAVERGCASGAGHLHWATAAGTGPGRDQDRAR